MSTKKPTTTAEMNSTIGNGSTQSIANTLNNTLNSAMGGGITESADKVERIRDLIFGTQMREYAKRFDTLTRDLTRLTQEVTRLGEQQREHETNFLKELRREIDRLLTQLQDQDKRQFQQMQTLDQRLTEQLHDLDQKQTQSIQNLAQSMARSEQSLRTELHELSSQLNDNKVDRPGLGELLIQLGNSLKVTDPEPLAISEDLLDRLSKELG